VWSRQGKDLTRHFPDIAAAAVAQLTPGTVLDGELVIWKDNRLDFGALQQRLTTSSRAIAQLARR
jgi:ATP-dependent DNA ligase